MASDDMVFVESGPSMQLISSPSMESADGSNSTKDIQHTYTPSSPSVLSPSLGCNPCRLAFRSKSDLQHCCHGSCQRHDQPAKRNETIMRPPMFMDFPPPPIPIYTGSPTSWQPPGARTNSKRTSNMNLPPSPSYHVRFLILDGKLRLTR